MVPSNPSKDCAHDRSNHRNRRSRRVPPPGVRGFVGSAAGLRQAVGRSAEAARRNVRRLRCAHRGGTINQAVLQRCVQDEGIPPAQGGNNHVTHAPPAKSVMVTTPAAGGSAGPEFAKRSRPVITPATLAPTGSGWGCRSEPPSGWR